METMAAMIKKARNDLGLTQNELAGKMGITGAYIAKLEKGGVSPSPVFVEKISQILNIDRFDLFLASIQESRLPEMLHQDIDSLRINRQNLMKNADVTSIMERLLKLAEEHRKAMTEICENILNFMEKVLDKPEDLR